MKKLSLLISVLIIITATATVAFPSAYRAPIKRLTADEIFTTIEGSPFGQDIRKALKNKRTPDQQLNDNWAWEHKDNGTILRFYFNESYIITRAVIQEFAYSPEDARGRTDILSGQYERRLGPPTKDETDSNHNHFRLWDIHNAMFLMMTNDNDANVMYIFQPK